MISIMDALDEIWKPLPGNEQFYEVSSHGRVRALFFKNGHGIIWRTKPQKLFVTRFGRITTPIWGHHKSVHRLVGFAFIPNPDNKPEINHKDGNPLNNHVSNLEWCTRRENALHAWANNLNHQARKSLTPERVREIRAALGTNTGSQRALAKTLGIRPQVLSKIKHRQLYMHVK